MTAGVAVVTVRGVFHLLSIAAEDVFADRRPPCPGCVRTFDGGRLSLADGETHFGFVLAGECRVRDAAGEVALCRGMWFCVPGEATVSGGRGIVCTRENWLGLRQFGGPVESTGRLRYIDGCRDTLLCGPPVLGDPCLNLLHIPPGTHQTAHTHPSLRAGVIVAGRGRCVTPGGEYPLTPGAAFVIEAETVHSFHTDDCDLRVIAYHPDSDTGPSHDDHPMVNRTIVDGVRAADIASIRTVSHRRERAESLAGARRR